MSKKNDDQVGTKKYNELLCPHGYNVEADGQQCDQFEKCGNVLCESDSCGSSLCSCHGTYCTTCIKQAMTQSCTNCQRLTCDCNLGSCELCDETDQSLMCYDCLDNVESDEIFKNLGVKFVCEKCYQMHHPVFQQESFEKESKDK